MASSYHVRSNSLPSRPHPISSEVDQLLCRLRSSQETSTSSSSVCREINGLQDLYECVNKVLSLPHTQQALGQEEHKKHVDELLNGSLRILDISSIAKEALIQMKENVQGLQSALRRRKDNEITTEVKKYLALRKTVKKTINKALKSMESKCSSKINEEHETVTMLTEVEAVTLEGFKSLLSLISGPKASPKSNWSLVSKFVERKRIASEEVNTNEFVKVDAALSALTSKSDNIISVQNQLKDMESNIQDLEEEIECLSRHLIKSRVSLLNIITN